MLLRSEFEATETGDFTKDQGCEREDALAVAHLADWVAHDGS